MKKNSFTTRLYLMYLIALVPLIIFGLYKNGIELYRKELVDLVTMFKPLIVLLMSIAGSILGALLREYKGTLRLDKNIFNKCKGNIIEGILLACILPLKSSPIILFITTFIFSLFLNKLKINRIALMYIIVESINVLFGLNSFSNAYLTSTPVNYDGIDLFWGLGPGGTFSTSILLILIGLLFLSFNKLYKKEMVISGLITFLILGIVPYMIMGEYDKIFPYIFGYNIIFIIVFIAPNLYSSSYTTKGQILSGILIGILTYGLSFLTPYTSAILAVLFVSLIKGIIDRIFVIK